MSETCWDLLPRPILGLAPMDGITNHPTRHIQKKYGRPAVIYTEFVAVERLDIGDPAMLNDFLYDESQRPVIAQIYGHIPARFRRMAVMLCELGFDGIDINMGCPASSIVHRGSGAGLILTPDIAQAIVAATKAGVADWQNGATLRDDPGVPAHLVAAVEARRRALPAAYQARRPIPVSVKTRIGYAAPQVAEWAPRLLESEPAAIAIHGRTLHQGYRGEANWDEIGVAAALARSSRTLILGNGDIRSYQEAQQRITAYGLDGVLIGRGSNGNPFVFQPESAAPENRYSYLHIALEHARLHERWISRGNPYRFLSMRKQLGWYARAVPGASTLRRALVETNSADEVEAVLRRYFDHRQTWEPDQKTVLSVCA
ncbi:MAG TPA: tRNA-dihydrouridine synthase [Chloroflexi bacterium]|nr:tRNA-dihydrouridine synthase [Chloroflexota bacterium]